MRDDLGRRQRRQQENRLLATRRHGVRQQPDEPPALGVDRQVQGRSHGHRGQREPNRRCVLGLVAELAAEVLRFAVSGEEAHRDPGAVDRHVHAARRALRHLRRRPEGPARRGHVGHGPAAAYDLAFHARDRAEHLRRLRPRQASGGVLDQPGEQPGVGGNAARGREAAPGPGDVLLLGRGVAGGAPLGRARGHGRRPGASGDTHRGALAPGAPPHRPEVPAADPGPHRRRRRGVDRRLGAEGAHALAQERAGASAGGLCHGARGRARWHNIQKGRRGRLRGRAR
mmetsp:Transcript_69251/g.200627  ORF Transcript_69251/g.200627 Transcript_69251/m.200627 type:complete len:285 (+) Transcript_69251:627-1481(+)